MPFDFSPIQKQGVLEFLEQSPCFVLVCDFDGWCLNANESTLKALGYKRKELCSLNVTDLLHTTQANQALKVLRKIRMSGEHKKISELKLRSKGNNDFWLLAYSGILSLSKTHCVAMTVGVEITELHNQVTQLIAANDQLASNVGKHRTVMEQARGQLERTRKYLNQQNRKVIDLHSRLKAERMARHEKESALNHLSAQFEMEKQKLLQRVSDRIRERSLPLLARIQAGDSNPFYLRILSRELLRITDLNGNKHEPLAAYGLSVREREVCRLLTNDLTTKEIASLLCISEKTVIRHRKNIRKKLGIAGKEVELASHLIGLF